MDETCAAGGPDICGRAMRPTSTRARRACAAVTWRVLDELVDRAVCASRARTPRACDGVRDFVTLVASRSLPTGGGRGSRPR
jgi:hypothetical protein